MMVAAMVVTASAAQAEPGRRIGLRVCYPDSPNSTQLATFAAGKLQASALYEAVGITLEWSGCEDRPIDEAAKHITILVVGDAHTKRIMSNSPSLRHNVLGIAMADTGRVYVFWDRIMRLGAARRALCERVLGWVLAHEIGHHLLPGKGHSVDGLMSPSLNNKVPQLPGFTAAQEDEIRTFLAASNG
jgi:hypothetical protein